MKRIVKITVFLFYTSCGIKGPPLPPQDESVVKKQKAEAVTVNTTKAPVAESADASSAQPNKNSDKKKSKK